MKMQRRRFVVAAALTALGMVTVGATTRAAVIYGAVGNASRHAGRQNAGWAAMQNVKQLCLAAFQFAENHGDRFPEVATFRTDVSPYLSNATVFTSPLDQPGTESFRLNAGMAGKKLAGVEKPSRTVLVFEGEPGKPLFRYAGKAVIGLADGSVKLVTPDEAAKLRW
jgi:hypothetical protein